MLGPSPIPGETRVVEKRFLRQRVRRLLSSTCTDFQTHPPHAG